MAFEIENAVLAVASIASDGSFIRQDGFASVANLGAGVYRLVLTQGIDRDECDIQVTARGGFVSGPRWINATTIDVLVFQETGAVNAPFDIVVLRMTVGPDIVPAADPIAVWGSAALGVALNPPIYPVAPTGSQMALHGAYTSVMAAIAAAIADGYGGVAPATRAIVLVCPGTYVEDILLEPGIDVCALQQAVGYPTPNDLPSASATVVGKVTLAAGAGGDPSTTWVYWRGIDIIQPAASIAIDFGGVNPQMMIMSECGVYQQNALAPAILLQNSALTASQFRMDRCYVTSPTQQCFFCAGTSTVNVNLHDCTLIGPLADEWCRADGPGQWDIEYFRL